MRMDRCDAIGTMRADDREVGHADLSLVTLLNKAYAAHAPLVAGGIRPHLVKQAAVDLEDDLQVARQ
jgi:hypothetical protein